MSTENTKTQGAYLPPLPEEVLQSMTVATLRGVARTRFADEETTSVASMTKADLITALLSGTLTPDEGTGTVDPKELREAIQTEILPVADDIHKRINLAGSKIQTMETRQKTLTENVDHTIGLVAEHDITIKSATETAVSARKTAEEAMELARKGGGASITIRDIANKETREIKGAAHKDLPDLISAVAQHLKVYMPGPAGSGKTTAARQVAEALGVSFCAVSLTEQTPATRLLGFVNMASGEYVRTDVRDAYENGGLVLLDEMDASDPNTLATANMLLDSPVAGFPDGIVKRHPEFYALGSGNTYGNGASRIYVGRNELDGATMNRFFFMPWNYDEELEFAVTASFCGALRKGSALSICGYVRQARRKAEELRARVVISPRQSIMIAQSLTAGFSWERATQGAIWHTMPEETARKIRAGVEDPKTIPALAK